MKIKIQGYLTALYMVLFQSTFVIFCSRQGSLKILAVIGLQRAKKQTPVYILLLSRESSFFYLPYLLQIAPQNLLCCEILNISLKD